MASRTDFVYDLSFSLDAVEAFMYRHSRDVMNRLRLSRIIEVARRIAPRKVPIYVSDVDSIIMRYLDEGRGRRFIGLEFKNMRPDVAFRGSHIKVNGKQYELHYYLSLRAGIDFYYLVKAGRYYFLWNVARAPSDFQWLGSRKNGTYDYYALIPKDSVARIPEEELPRYLSDLIFGG